MVLASLGLSDATLHVFADVLQGVVVDGMVLAVPSLSPAGPVRKVASLYLLHLRFVGRVAGYSNLPPI